MPEAIELRRRAELRLQERTAAADPPQTDADAQLFLHELQVHQIELEMQNEALQQARDEVETALEKYSDLFDFAPMAYVTLNRDGTIREANLAAASLCGIERASLLGRRIALQVTAADRPAFASFLEAIRQGQARELLETTLVRQGGDTVAVRVEAAMAASGEEYRVALSDVTERNRAELERLINSKLEATGILAGGIAHDLNNLLTVVLLDLAQASSLIPPQGRLAHHLEGIKSAVQSAHGVATQLITFAAGGGPARRPTRVGELIRTATREACQDSRYTCAFAVPGDLWVANIDAGQIAQVIRNVVRNAQEAMPAGGMIRVSAENLALAPGGTPSLSPGDYVRVSIVDHGSGIAPEVLPKIFDPYFSTRQRGAERAVGLGLTVCHAVMRKHGGGITAESPPGAGGTLRLYLPASRTATVKAEPATPVDATRPLHILILDDARATRRAMEATLRRMGHDVDVADDGPRAVDECRDALNLGCPFDLVLLDLMLGFSPGGGVAVMEELRHLDSHLNAIVMTDDPTNPVALDPRHFGFKAALLKPFDARALEEIVGRIAGT